MAFLTKDDLKTVALPEIVDMITRGDNEVISQIIAENTDIVRTYLGANYDMDQVFAASPKNGVILKILKALVIRDIYKIRRKSVPQKEDEDYQEAMKFLEDVSAGKLSVALPKLMPTDINGDGVPDEVPFMKLGGRRTYNNHW